ncbi:MAG: HD domain-containing protein [Anaerolineales bacterium]|jgi:(p)ppGpp synthase/HD superfamily hydrolase
MINENGDPIKGSPTSTLGDRFESALLFALRLHSNQTRKGTSVPYISHLMSVSSLVLESGGSEDEAIAALLHDSVEDQGGIATLEKIRLKFGNRIAEIVDGCTDSYTIPKSPWKSRKKAYLEKLDRASVEVHRVSLADKLHNARSLLRDLRIFGEPVWNKFSGGKTGTLWYYHELIKTYKKIGSNWMIDELENVVKQIEIIGGSHDPG